MIVRFSGFGGQGIILMGYIFGAAAIKEGKYVVQTQSYGSEARGGACKSDVIISKEEIYELVPSKLDVLCAMSQLAYEKFIPNLKENGILIIDSDLININKDMLDSMISYKLYKIPSSDFAFKKFKNKIFGNMIVLGYMTSITKLVSKEFVIGSIEKNVPKGSVKLNVMAFLEGYNRF